jgi:hypothetical protein
MNTRTRNYLVGLFALTLCGSAMAHGPQAGTVYPDRNVVASAVVWGNSGGFSGWAGSLNLNAVYGYVPRYAIQVVPVPSGHRHGPSCHHGSRHGVERSAWKRHRHGHAPDRGHGRYDHH